MKNQSSSSKSNRNREFLFMAFLVLTLDPGGNMARAAQISWTGQVVDIRSGQSVANVEAYGGARGRVDLTAPSLTGPDGLFRVTYDTPLDLSIWSYYMLTAYQKTETTYFLHRSISAAPSPTVVRMVPRSAFLRGMVRDRVSGQVVAGAQVNLGVPGAYVSTVSADAQGGFQFNAVAYEGSNNYEEGIPAAEQVPHESFEQVQRKTNYWLEVSASGYRTLRTSDQGLTIHLLSSLTPDLHTWVTLDLVPTSTNLLPGATTQIVNPYGLQLWLGQFFTTQQMTNAAITGATADPDVDGLFNQQEFEIGTNPTLADTDGDTLPDGWEAAQQMNPLVADANLDPDGDGYNNRLEFLYGSNPQDLKSTPDLRLSILRAVHVDFPALAGVRYQLQTASALDGPWENTGNSFPGDGSKVAQYFDAEAGRQQYFRLTISGQ